MIVKFIDTLALKTLIQQLYSILTIVDYLMPNPLYTYILSI